QKEENGRTEESKGEQERKQERAEEGLVPGRGQRWKSCDPRQQWVISVRQPKRNRDQHSHQAPAEECPAHVTQPALVVLRQSRGELSAPASDWVVYHMLPQMNTRRGEKPITVFFGSQVELSAPGWESLPLSETLSSRSVGSNHKELGAESRNPNGARTLVRRNVPWPTGAWIFQRQ